MQMHSQSARVVSLGSPSPRVTSGQTGPHRDLIRVLERHRDRPYRKPIAAHTRAAFAWVKENVATRSRPLILDSGCGIGAAARELARQNPERWVVGVDQSAHRLRRAGWAEPGLRCDNLLLARAELADFWRLALAARWRLERHYLLYPSPWPKPGQLRRRWHAHPVFEALLGLGGRLELRTNWRIYADEFVIALEFFGHGAATVRRFEPAEALTPFERKFAASQHPLFRVTVDLGRTEC